VDRNQTLDRLEGALIAGRIDRRAFIAGAIATGLVLSSAVPALADEHLRRHSSAGGLGRLGTGGGVATATSAGGGRGLGAAAG
jgi:hypothetical protein